MAAIYFGNSLAAFRKGGTTSFENNRMEASALPQ